MIVKQQHKFLTRKCLDMNCAGIPEPVDPQICQATCAIMKLSFEEEYRRAMNELGMWNHLPALLKYSKRYCRTTRKLKLQATFKKRKFKNVT